MTAIGSFINDVTQITRIFANCRYTFLLSAFIRNFFLCLDCWHSDVPPHFVQPHFVQPCYVALGQALIWGFLFLTLSDRNRNPEQGFKPGTKASVSSWIWNMATLTTQSPRPVVDTPYVHKMDNTLPCCHSQPVTKITTTMWRHLWPVPGICRQNCRGSGRRVWDVGWKWRMWEALKSCRQV